MPYCVECGGKLTWDRRLKMYFCQSCGLSYTEAELSEAMERLHSMRNEDERSRRYREYLDWWLSKKDRSRR